MAAITLPSAVRGPVRMVADDFRGRREAVQLPSRDAVAGVASLPEILATYGIYIFFAAVALVGAVIILNNILAEATQREVQQIVTAVQDMYRHARGADKTGLTNQVLINSNRLNDKLHDGNTAIAVGGGDYPVQLFVRAGTEAGYDDLGHTSNRTVGMVIGDSGSPVEQDLCVDLLLSNMVGTVAVAAPTAAVVTSLATASGSPDTATHWSSRHVHADVTNINTINTIAAETACAGGTQQVLIVFR